MARGNWKAAAYIDERASEAAYDGLLKIFSGQAKGTTGLFKVLVSEFLGAERAPVSYENEGKKRRLIVGKAIKGEVVPVPADLIRTRISWSQTPNTGWARTSRSQPPHRAVYVPMAVFGTLTAAAPKSVRSTGLVQPPNRPHREGPACRSRLCPSPGARARHRFRAVSRKPVSKPTPSTTICFFRLCLSRWKRTISI
jgi:hypothetical protein